MASRLFVIDSSPAIRRLVEQSAKAEGYDVSAFHDGPSAIEEAQQAKPKIIFADYHLEGLTFSTFCEKLNALDLDPTPSLVLLTNSSDRCDENAMRSKGVSAFLHKPLQQEQILEVIHEVQENGQAAAALAAVRRSRAWPPESNAIESESDVASLDVILPELEVHEPAPSIVSSGQSVGEDMKPVAAAAGAAAASRDKIASTRMSAAAPVAPHVVGTASSTEVPPPPSSLPKNAPLEASKTVVSPAPAAQPLAAKPKPDRLPTAVSPTAASESSSAAKPGLVQKKSVEAKGSDTMPPPKEPTTHTTEIGQPPPLPPSPPSPPGKMQNTATPPSPSPSGGDAPSAVIDAAAQKLLSDLVDLIAQRCTLQLTQHVTETVSRGLMAELQEKVRTEVSAQIAAAPTDDHVRQTVQDAIRQELPGIVSQKVSDMESAMQQQLNDQVAAAVKDATSNLVRDQLEPAVQKQLPEVVRAHVGSAEGLVKEIAHEAAAQIVRDVAGEQVGQLVATAVPDIAEAEIKKEIQRLTGSA